MKSGFTAAEVAAHNTPTDCWCKWGGSRCLLLHAVLACLGLLRHMRGGDWPPALLRHSRAADHCVARKGLPGRVTMPCAPVPGLRRHLRNQGGGHHVLHSQRSPPRHGVLLCGFFLFGIAVGDGRAAELAVQLEPLAAVLPEPAMRCPARLRSRPGAYLHLPCGRNNIFSLCTARLLCAHTAGLLPRSAGGNDIMFPCCGKDCTKDFDDEHRGQRAHREQAAYYIGDLAA